MIEPLRVYIGYDPREDWAYRVAADSIRRRSSVPVLVLPIHLRQLELAGILRRPRRRIDKGSVLLIGENGIQRRVTSAAQRGTMWDDISGAPMSTEFAISRFAVPILAHTGWAAFLDCDVVALGDIAELFALADDEFAVMCVHHGKLPENGLKMDGQQQLPYARKNWSSVVLYNCDHPAQKGLTLDLLNRLPGRDLHRFCWLDDRWIGELPAEWNWLVGVNPRPPSVKLAHFTLGGPWLPGWVPHVHDELWLAAAEDLRAGDRTHYARRSEGSR